MKPLKNNQLAKFTAYLSALSLTGTHYAACKSSTVARQTIEGWIKDRPELQDRANEAIELFRDNLECEAVRRASLGMNDPVFYKGEICGHRLKYSDTLLIKLLEANRPAKYAARQMIDQHTTTQGEIEHIHTLPAEEQHLRLEELQAGYSAIQDAADGLDLSSIDDDDVIDVDQIDIQQAEQAEQVIKDERPPWLPDDYPKGGPENEGGEG